MDRTGEQPPPLPVRGGREERPNPAEARPGIRPDGRQALAEHGTAPPAPRDLGVRDTADRPRLPRRRAQENLVPQLRGGPAPRQDTEPAGHDPGLMAAFRRGMSLAETQPAPEGGPAATPPPATPRGATTATTATTTSSALLDLTAARAARAELPTRHDGKEPAG